jgi:hypothetical protein
MFKEIENLMVEGHSKKDIEYWPLLKHHIIIRQANKNGIEDLQYKSSSKLRLFLALLLSIFNLVRAYFSSSKKAFFGASSRAVIKNDSVKDEFLADDKLVDFTLLYHCSNFEKVCLKSAFKKKVVFENILMKCFTIGRVFFVKQKNISSNYFSSKLLKTLQQDFDLEASDIDSIVFDFENKKQFYSLLLRFLRVDKVWLISSYTKAAIISASNNLKIETTELQHGLLAPYHPSYSFSGACPWSSSLLPRHLLLTSSFWLSFMKKSNFVDKLNISVNELAKDNTNILDTYCSSLQEGGGYILFTGQGICYNEVFDFICEFLSLNPTVKFVYRPHPREHLNYLAYTEHILPDNFVVIDRDSYADTKQLVRGAKAHISIFSSCHFEAIELLNKTYVLDIIDNNLMEAGRGDDNIVFFKNAHELSLN